MKKIDFWDDFDGINLVGRQLFFFFLCDSYS